jgi:hypothetical protein
MWSTRAFLGLAAALALCTANLAPADQINLTGGSDLEVFGSESGLHLDALDLDGDFLFCPEVPDPLVEPIDPVGCFANSFWTLNYRNVGNAAAIDEFIAHAVDGDLPATPPFTGWINTEIYADTFTGCVPVGTCPQCDPTCSPICQTSIDIAALSTPMIWQTSVTGAPGPLRLPGEPGYGQSPKVAGVGPDAEPQQLRDLCSMSSGTCLNTNTSLPDAQTVFDTPVAWSPIAYIANRGAANNVMSPPDQLTYTELQFLFLTGRLPSGENLVAATRDISSPTRTGAAVTTGIDPSYAVGDNTGPSTTALNSRRLGPGFQPNSHVGSSGIEEVVQNSRLAVGYAGLLGGSGAINAAFNGRYEILGVVNDLQGGTMPTRPTQANVLNNSGPNGYNIGSYSTFASLGDPLFGAFPTPRLETSLFVQNHYARLASFFGFDPCSEALPPLLYVQMLSGILPLADPTFAVPNPELNFDLQTALTPAVFPSDPPPYGSTTPANLVPERVPSPTWPAESPCDCAYPPNGTYSDGSPSGAYLNRWTGTYDILPGMLLNPRNAIAGDFNGDGIRDTNDIGPMLLALFDPQQYVVDSGFGGGPSDPAVPEILGDFNGDGNFDCHDVRYFCDGLGVDFSNGGILNRASNFQQVDFFWELLTGDNNFFNTTLIGCGGAPLNDPLAPNDPGWIPGASMADVAGGGPALPGASPVGGDCAVDVIDRTAIADGLGDWLDLQQAVHLDLSHDLNGDLQINLIDVATVESLIGGACDIGACCLAGGSCSVLPGETCQLVEGYYLGDGTSCETAICPEPCECPVDLDGDCDTDSDDFHKYEEYEGTTTSDLNNDGQTDMNDVSTLQRETGCTTTQVPPVKRCIYELDCVLGDPRDVAALGLMLGDLRFDPAVRCSQTCAVLRYSELPGEFGPICLRWHFVDCAVPEVPPIPGSYVPFCPCECEPGCAVALTGGKSCPGETITIQATITNPGTCSATYDWTISQVGGNAIVVGISPNAGSVSLLPGESITFPVDVMFSPGSPRDIAVLRLDAGNNCFVDTIIDLRPMCDAELTDGEACPDESDTIQATITNTGPCEETFNWTITKINGSQTLTITPNNGAVTLGPGESITFPVTVDVDEMSDRGDATLELQVSGDGGGCSDTATFHVPPPECDVSIAVPPDAKFCPKLCVGTDDQVTVTITNTGKCEETFDWTITKSAGDPTLTFNPDMGTVTLGPGESIDIQVTVDVADDSKRGTATLKVEVTGDDGASCETEADIDISEPMCDVRIRYPNGTDFCPGTMLNIEVEIENTGNCEEDFDWSLAQIAGPAALGLAPNMGTETLCPGDEVTITVTVTIPMGAPRGKNRLEAEVKVDGEVSCTRQRTLTVPKPQFSARLSRMGPYRVCPGAAAVTQLKVTNTGKCTETFTWAAVFGGNPLINAGGPAPGAGMFTLAPGASGMVNITITTAAPPVPRERFKLEVTITDAEGNTRTVKKAYRMETVQYRLNLSTPNGCPPTAAAAYPFTITNIGNCPETYTIAVTPLSGPAVTIAPLAAAPALAPGGSASPFTYTVAATANPGLYNFRFTITTDSSTRNFIGSVRVPLPDCEVVLPPLRMCPNDTITLPITLVNQSACPETYQWTLVQVNGPPLGIAPANGMLAMPATSFTLNLSSQITSGPTLGTADVGINVFRVPPGGGAPQFTCGWITTITIANDPNCGLCTIDAWIDSNNNLQFDAGDDPVEAIAPGKSICLNSDDDNADGSPDLADAGATAGEDDLVPLLLLDNGLCQPVGTEVWSITYGPNVRVYANNDRTGFIPSGALNAFPVTSPVWVEGVTASAFAGDTSIVYTVETAGGGGVLAGDTVLVTVVPADIDADNDRDGTVDAGLDFDELTQSALVLANVDDDDQDGTRDADDTIVNGTADVDDLAAAVLRTIPGLPLDHTVRLQLSVPAGDTDPTPPEQRVRLFDQRAVGGVEIFGPGIGTTYDLPAFAPGGGASAAAIRAGDVTLGVEGLTFATQVVLTMQVLGPNSDIICQDDVLIEVAPLLLFSNANADGNTYVSNPGGSCLPANPLAFTIDFANNSGVANLTVTSSDRWLGDEWEIGYSRVPAAGGPRNLPIVIDVSRGGDIGNFTGALLDPGFGVVTFADMVPPAAIDFASNLSASGPVTVGGADFRVGRVLVGEDPNVPATNALTTFFTAQGIQEPVAVDTSWLAGNWIENAVSIVPDASTADTRDFRVLVADPLAAITLLQAVEAAGRGEELIMRGRGPTYELSVEDFLNDTGGLLTYNLGLQTPLTNIAADLQADLGLAATDIIAVPALFAPLAPTNAAHASVANVGNIGLSLLPGDFTQSASPTDATHWRVEFCTATTFDVYYADAYHGEFVLDGSGDTSNAYASPTGAVTIPSAAWSGTAVAGDAFWFRTVQPTAEPLAVPWFPALQNAQVVNDRLLTPVPQGPQSYLLSFSGTVAGPGPIDIDVDGTPVSANVPTGASATTAAAFVRSALLAAGIDADRTGADVRILSNAANLRPELVNAVTNDGGLAVATTFDRDPFATSFETLLTGLSLDVRYLDSFEALHHLSGGPAAGTNRRSVPHSEAGARWWLQP